MKSKQKPLVGLPSLSLDQLARRWGCTEGDVADYIRTGVLTAHVLLHNESAALTGSRRGNPRLDGHYRLPVASAVALLDPKSWSQTDDLGFLAYFSFDVVAKEPDTMARVTMDVGSTQRCKVRVMRDEVERFESANAQNERLRAPLRDNQRHRERCRAIAALLWERDQALTIEDMIGRDEITRLGQEGVAYDPKTLRDWIKDLCPNRAPGRRPKTPA